MPDTALMQFLFYMKVNVYLYNFNLYKSLRGYLQADNIRIYRKYTKTVGLQWFVFLRIVFSTIIFHFPFSILCTLGRNMFFNIILYSRIGYSCFQISAVKTLYFFDRLCIIN